MSSWYTLPAVGAAALLAAVRAGCEPRPGGQAKQGDPTREGRASARLNAFGSQVDVTAASNSMNQTCFGGRDRRALDLSGNRSGSTNHTSAVR